jgi:predicted nucleic acid-binding protein
VSKVLVDSNVIIDVAQSNSAWRDWSEHALRQVVNRSVAVINPIIYAELAAGYAAREKLEEVLAASSYQREDLPWNAGFMAGRCFVEYRRRGGARTSPLPDFYIGAHAVVRRYKLLTRDARRYRGYFPKLELICPPEA